MLNEIPPYMDMGAKGKSFWKSCPEHLKEHLAFFLDHGYIVLRKSLPAEYVAQAQQEFATHKAKYAERYAVHADSNGFQRRLVNLHMALPSFRDVFSKNTVALELQDYLFGSKSSCYTSLTFESGSEQDIHRDSPYFTTNPEYYYLGVWTALEYVDERNGALQVYDGGHLLHDPDRGAIVDRFYKEGEDIDQFDANLWDTYQAETAAMCKARNIPLVTVAMEPGDTLIWHPQLPHGGAVIQEPHRTRLSIVNHVTPSHVPVSGMAVFFGRRPAPSFGDYPYIEHDGRMFHLHRFVEFAHRDPVAFEEFGV